MAGSWGCLPFPKKCGKMTRASTGPHHSQETRKVALSWDESRASQLADTRAAGVSPEPPHSRRDCGERDPPPPAVPRVPSPPLPQHQVPHLLLTQTIRFKG